MVGRSYADGRGNTPNIKYAQHGFILNAVT